MASPAQGQSRDPTGLWMDPAESGWGMSVAQQGDTSFVVLHVYDDAHRPAWYVANDVLAGTNLGPSPGSTFFHGRLYRTSGPWFGGAFDPRAVGITEVGTIAFAYVANAPATLTLAYTIDGVQVGKTLVPQSWGENRSLLPGRYVGARPVLSVSPATCDPNGLVFLPPATAPFDLSVTAGRASNEMHVTWNVGVDFACSIDGVYSQRGQLAAVTGALACTPTGGAPTRIADAELSELAIGPHGFMGLATFNKGSCTYTSNFGGVRQP